MRTVQAGPGNDFSAPHIDRILHKGTIYVIETEADYDALPQEVKDAIAPPPVEGGDL